MGYWRLHVKPVVLQKAGDGHLTLREELRWFGRGRVELSHFGEHVAKHPRIRRCAGGNLLQLLMHAQMGLADLACEFAVDEDPLVVVLVRVTHEHDVFPADVVVRPTELMKLREGGSNASCSMFELLRGIRVTLNADWMQSDVHMSLLISLALVGNLAGHLLQNTICAQLRIYSSGHGSTYTALDKWNSSRVCVERCHAVVERLCLAGVVVL